MFDDGFPVLSAAHLTSHKEQGTQTGYLGIKWWYSNLSFIILPKYKALDYIKLITLWRVLLLFLDNCVGVIIGNDINM